MPKVIVLFSGAKHRTTATLAQAVASGAARVRFTEVDVRATSDAGVGAGRAKVLGGDEQLRDYDGVVFVASPPDADSELSDLLEAAERDQPASAFLNTVFAVTAVDAALLARVAQLGGIIVTVPQVAGDPERFAELLGERVAKVVEWVRHARSHEHDHAHTHSHHHHG